MNLGFSKDVLKDKATIALNVNDVFNSRIRRMETYIPGQIDSNSEMQRRKRQITLSFTYRFNKQKNEKEKQPKRESDNNGTYNYATVTHKTLNKIGALAGLNSSETGNIIWTVFSSKGVNEVKAEEVRTMTITRLAGFAEVPTDVYVTGEGSEGGADLSKAIKFKAVANGEFEIYTKLTAGKKYHFADGTNAAAKTYFADGEVLKENGESTVAKTGVYRINLDFTTGAVVYTEISKMEIFFAPTNSY
jgi:hypothetical protein